MAGLLSSLAVLGVVTPAVLALPVATPHAAVPHAVRPSVVHLAVRGGLGQTGTKPFSMVGVTWKHDPGAGSVAAEVRWRAHRTWSSWTPLGGLADEGPDAHSRDTASADLRDGTSPLWVGTADGVQVRVTTTGVAPRDMRVELVDPGRSAADAAVGATPRDTASALENQPTILTRADWGADESIRRADPAYSATVKVGFVHHTDTANDYTMDQTAAVIRSIYAYHVASKGWNDIGYNYLVDRFGRIWEGRYGGITRAVIGTHTGGFNVSSFGTALIGTFTSATPPAAMLTSLERLFAWKLGSSYRDPAGIATLVSGGGSSSRYAAGVLHTFAVISGHRDAGYTACPGDVAYARLGAIRAAVSGFLGTAFVNPTISATSVVAGAEDRIAVQARARNAPSWTLDITTRLGVPVRTWSGPAGTPIDATWDLTDVSGAPVPVGLYTVTLRGSSADGDTALPWVQTVRVRPPEVPKGAWMSPGRYSTRYGSPQLSP